MNCSCTAQHASVSSVSPVVLRYRTVVVCAAPPRSPALAGPFELTFPGITDVIRRRSDISGENRFTRQTYEIPGNLTSGVFSVLFFSMFFLRLHISGPARGVKSISLSLSAQGKSASD